MKIFIRYLNLLLITAKYSFMESMEYRFQAVTRFVRAIIEVGLVFLVIEAFFQKTHAIGSWGKEELLLLFAVFTMINATVYVFISYNLQTLGGRVMRGELDGLLLKPANDQFLISMTHMHIQNVTRVVIAILLGVYAIKLGGINVDAGEFIVFSILVVCAVLTYFSLLSLVATLSFWTLTEELYSMADTTFAIARFPLDIFSRPVVKVVTIIPLLFLSTVPTKALLGTIDRTLLLAPFITIVSLVFARRFFLFALKGYSSASS